MWKQLIGALRHLLSLARRVDKNDEDVRALQEELKAARSELAALRRDLSALAHLTEKLIGEVQHDRELAAVQQRNLVLELENRLLRIESAARSGQGGNAPHLTP